MIKRPFVTFMLVIGTLVGGLIWFIQSPQFAWVLKTVAYRYLPKDIGVQGDFSEFSIRIFPPGFSIRNPKLTLSERNIVNLPAGSSVSAERIDFNFRLFQIFSGDIRIHEVMIVNGDIHLILDQRAPEKPPKAKSAKLDFHWDELLQVKADAIGLNDVNLSVQIKGSEHTFEVSAKQLRLSQWEGHGGLGYSILINLNQIKADQLKDLGFPGFLEHIQGEAYLNALGLQLESLFVSNPSSPGGLDISVVGQVKGNILEPKKLMADINVKAKGEIGKILKIMPISKNLKELPQGFVSFAGKVQGDLIKPMETLHVDGQLIGKGVEFQKWKADLVHVDAKWDASPTGGEISLTKATLSSREQVRVGGNQPGGGGKVEIGPARWVVGSVSPLKVPLRLERAHVHWLAGGGVADVYPLDFRISGTVGAGFSPPRRDHPWELEAQLGLALEPFQLDNQRYLRTKPLNTVFKIPKVGVNGSIIVSPSEIRPANLVISMPHTKLIANGKINFKTGYDLYGGGYINLADLGNLAENEIRGQGTVGVHVHGPSSSVMIDIDSDFKEAYYLNLFLGDVKGRIAWNDGPQYLLFNKVQLTKNSTHCVVDGKLDLGQADTVDLDTTVSDGNIQDLFQIFGYMTRDLDWFPHDLTGPVKGDIKVSGGIGLSKLKILSHLNGSNWERWGERFKSVSLVGGYDKGKYQVSEFKALKRTGRFLGRISYDVDRKLNWDFHTEDLVVNDLDHIAQLDVPIRGRLKVDSSGKGVEGAIESNTEASLTDFSVRGSWMPSSRLSWKTEKGISRIQGLAIGGQGVLDILYDFNPKEMSSIHGEFKQLDFSPILLLLNPKSIQDKSLAGSVSGTADLSFHSGQVERATGSLNITDYLLSRSDARFVLANPVSVVVSSGNFEINDLTIKGKTGEASLELVSKNTVLEGVIRGGLDTAIAEFFTPSIVQASGTANIDLAVGGTLKQPTLFGSAKFDGGAVRIASLDSPIENITGSLQLRQNTISVQSLRADLGGGAVSADGRIVLYGDRYPEIALKGVVSGSKVKIYPFQYAQVKGSIGVHGEKIPYTVDGYIAVDSALCKEKVFSQKQGGGGLKALPYAPPPSKSQETSSSKFKLNIEVDADRGILIQNDLFRDVEAKGSMTLVNSLDSPKVVGHAEIIRGKLLFKDHAFQIQNATANFDNPNVINPSFDMNANTEVNGIKIQMYASGRLDKINKIEFISSPPMQETEILSLLAVGLTSNDAKKLSSSDQNVVQQGEVTSLLLHSLDFNRDFEDKTGFQVQLDESSNPQQGVSAFRPQSQADTSMAPQITIRRKLGDRLSLSAGSTVGVGSNKSNQVNLDFSVSPDVSVSGVFTNYGTTGTGTGTADAQQNTQNSVGLDLKFQKRFK